MHKKDEFAPTLGDLLDTVYAIAGDHVVILGSTLPGDERSAKGLVRGHLTARYTGPLLDILRDHLTEAGLIDRPLDGPDGSYLGVAQQVRELMIGFDQDDGLVNGVPTLGDEEAPDVEAQDEGDHTAS